MNKEVFAKILFLIAGLINFAPVAGILGDSLLTSAYAIDVASTDLSLLLRHRAVLFGIVGGLLLVAAFRPALRPVASVCGFVSMISFAALYLTGEHDNAKLDQVFWFDVVGIVSLAAAMLLHKHQNV